MSDITKVFKATVKAVKSRNKNQETDSQRTNIFPSTKHRTDFSKKAKELINNITSLRDFLLEHKREYINTGSLLKNGGREMNDAERDQIDVDAQSVMKTCSEAIKLLKIDVFKDKMTPQVKEHREVIFEILQSYLKAVCKIYSEQRAIRVKRVVDRKRIARLEPENKIKNIRKSRSVEETNGKVLKGQSDAKEMLKAEIEEAKARESPKIASQPAFSFDPTEDEDDLSPEEMKMLEMENKYIYEEMNSLVDEVRQIEGKVVEISRLQDILTENVLDQERNIDMISDKIVHTTENIKEGNEELREAMKKNAGFRVWILFFVVVVTFTLLFLDWYNY